ncbi:Crp/Fnr family transcriptional regulator [Larkinella bovis]|uniref:Crp/Fnr family transcriptional regulator n=1 Tax=Larkinella bovis TaxID=683041 RepID=A0ABW0I7Y5_9BACT
MKQSKTGCALTNCLFCAFSQEAWLPVLNANRQVQVYAKGETIFTEGTPVTGVYFIDDGLVKIHQSWPSQKQLILNFAGRGDMIGYRALGQDPMFPVTATTLAKTAVCFVDLPFFELALETNPRLTYQLMKFYANALQKAEKRMRNLALMDVKGRVADTLLMLDRRFGRDENGYIDVLLTRQDMAAYAGTTYETFFRMLAELKTGRLVAEEKKKIAILDENRLQSLLHVVS